MAHYGPPHHPLLWKALMVSVYHVNLVSISSIHSLFIASRIIQDQLIFKGPVVVIPVALRAKCHASHIGVESCLRRARESMFWPRMSSDLKEYIMKCDVCLAYQNAPHKETIIQHEVTAWPWAKVGADLCDALAQ